MPRHCLILSDTFPNRIEPWRGPYNRRQVECLAEFCKVTVIDPIPWPRIIRDSRFRKLARQPDTVLENIPIHHPPFYYLPMIGRSRHWRGILSAARRTLRRIGPASFDSVLATFAYPHGLAAKYLAADLGIPYAIKVRGTDLHGLMPGTHRSKLTAEALRSASAIIAVSSNLARIAASLGAPAARIHLLTNGIDADRFRIIERTDARKQLGLPAEGRIVLFVGSLLPVKGIDILLEAIGTTLLRNPHNVAPPPSGENSQPGTATLRPLFAIAGKGPLQGLIEKHANNAPGSIRLLGQLAREEICLWMNAADVLALPSRNEGCPNVVLEALACGTPVVASKVGAVPDLLYDDSGILVEPVTPSALAHAIHQALARAWDRAAIRQCVEHKSWPENARALYHLLRRATGNTPGEERSP